MTDRITRTHLQAQVDRLNRLTGAPATPYTKQPDGTYVANVGNHHLSGAYGGWCVHRMVSETGGVSTPIVHGHVPARHLYDLLGAYLRGYEDAQREQQREQQRA